MRIHKMYAVIHILWYSSCAWSMVTIIPSDTKNLIAVNKNIAHQSHVIADAQEKLRGPIPLALTEQTCLRMAKLLAHTTRAQLHQYPANYLKSILSKKTIHTLQECIITADFLDCPLLLEAALNTFIYKITTSPHTLWQWRTIMDQGLHKFPPNMIYKIDAILRKNITDQLAVLNTEKIKKAARQYISSNPISCIGLSPDNKVFVTGTIHGYIYFWSAQRKKRLGISLDIHTEPITSLHFNRESTMIASTSAADKKIQLWIFDNIDEFTPLGETFEGKICDLSLDGNKLAIPQDNYTIHVYGTQSHQLVCSLHGHTDDVKSVCFNRNSSMLASYADDNTVCIWDIQNNTCITHIPISSAPITKLYFDKESTMLISQHIDDTVNTWDVQKGTLSSHTYTQQAKLYKNTAGHPTNIFNDIYSHNMLPISTPITGKIKTLHDAYYCISADQTQIAISLLDNHMVILWNLFDTTTLDTLNTIKTTSNTDELLLLCSVARFARTTTHIDLRKYTELRRQYNQLPSAIHKLLKQCVEIKQ